MFLQRYAELTGDIASLDRRGRAAFHMKRLALGGLDWLERHV
jgi:hypothetical protein